MPKKTLALISGLVLITIVLFIIALRAEQQQSSTVSQSPTVTSQPTPMIPAHTVLQLEPNSLTVGAGQEGSVSVNINTSDNAINGAQLEIGYDPTIISNVKVTYGSLFANPVVLRDKNDPVAGRYTYVIGLTPSEKPVNGAGSLATITFTTNVNSVGKSMQIGLLPTSIISSPGITQSVLKSETGTTLIVTAPTSRYNTGVGTTSGNTVPAKGL